MLQNSYLVLQQTLVMCIVMLFGYILYKKNFVDNVVSKSLSRVVNTFVTPCAIIISFNRAFDASLANSLVWLAFAGIVMIFVSVGVVTVLFPKSMASACNKRVCALFPNNGFMALPLVSALFGDDGVLLASISIAISAVTLYTYGVHQLSASYKFRPRSLLTNPGIIAAVGGMLLFLSPVKLPYVLSQGVSYIGGLNTPLGMIILGIYMAQLDLKDCFIKLDTWVTTAVRILLIPAITIALALLLPIDDVSKYVLVIGLAAPCAVSTAMFAQLYDTDYLFATRAVALSTILSLLTLPLSVAVLGALLYWVG